MSSARYFHDRRHVIDLARELLLVEQAVRDVSVERVHRTETIAGVGFAEVLHHLPEHAAALEHEGIVDLAHQGDAALSVFGQLLAEPR